VRYLAVSIEAVVNSGAGIVDVREIESRQLF
jgi:hypothetical protein